MSRKAKPRATTKQIPDGVIPLSPEELEKYTRIAHENFIAAQANALKLVESRKEDDATGHPTKADLAMAFLWFSSRLAVTIDLADKDEAVKAALFLGAATASFFSNRNGRTMLEIEKAYEGHSTGGENTGLLKEDQIETFIRVCQKYEGQDKAEVKIGNELFDHEITGREKDTKMSPRSIKRHIKTLKEKGQWPIDPNSSGAE